MFFKFLQSVLILGLIALCAYNTFELAAIKHQLAQIGNVGSKAGTHPVAIDRASDHDWFRLASIHLVNAERSLKKSDGAETLHELEQGDRAMSQGIAKRNRQIESAIAGYREKTSELQRHMELLLKSGRAIMPH